MALKSIILSFIFVFFIGGLGGVFLQRSILPWLAGASLLSEIKFLEESGRGTTVINRTENVTIEDNEIIKQSIAKVVASVLLLEAKDKNGKLLSRQSGIAVTNDGNILTVYSEAAQFFLHDDKRTFPLIAIKKDKKRQLILLKAEQSNFSTVPFVQFEDLKLGESVFLAGAVLTEKQSANEASAGVEKFINLGNIRSISENGLSLNIPDDKMAAGASLFNNKGELAGISEINGAGEISVIDIRKIRESLNE